jgi:hypothetical protein
MHPHKPVISLNNVLPAVCAAQVALIYCGTACLLACAVLLIGNSILINAAARACTQAAFSFLAMCVPAVGAAQ